MTPERIKEIKDAGFYHLHIDGKDYFISTEAKEEILKLLELIKARCAIEDSL